MKTTKVLFAITVAATLMTSACKKEPLEVPTIAPSSDVVFDVIDDSLRGEFNNAMMASGGCITAPAPIDPPVQLGAPAESTQVVGSQAWDCTTQSYQMGASFQEVAIFNPNSISYIGSVLDGGSTQNGAWTPLVFNNRNPVTITTTLNTGVSPASYIMDDPSLAAYNAIHNTFVNTALPGTAPAYILYESHEVKAREEVVGRIGAHVGGWGGQIDGQYGWENVQQRTKYLLKVAQVYYTLDIVPKATPDEWFGDLPDFNQLAPRCPVYVASVTYGRMIYITIETSSSSQEVEAALSASWSGFGASASVDFTNSSFQSLEEKSINAFVVGGSAAGASTGLAAGDINNIITSGGEFSPTSPGVPIAFTARRLSDNSIVDFVTISEYSVQECQLAGDIVTANIQNGSWRDFPPIHTAGDEEFGGNGPEVTGTFQLQISQDGTRVEVVADILFDETITMNPGNDTQAECNQVHTLYTAPNGKRISTIDVNQLFSLNYMEGGNPSHSAETLNINSGFIDQIIINGDTDGDDLPCDMSEERAYMKVKFKAFPVTLVDQE